jgi:hypothetical protein
MFLFVRVVSMLKPHGTNTASIGILEADRSKCLHQRNRVRASSTWIVNRYAEARVCPGGSTTACHLSPKLRDWLKRLGTECTDWIRLGETHNFIFLFGIFTQAYLVTTSLLLPRCKVRIRSLKPCGTRCGETGDTIRKREGANQQASLVSALKIHDSNHLSFLSLLSCLEASSCCYKVF